MMIHNEQELFTCDVENCEETFKVNKNLWEHQKNDHGIFSEKGKSRLSTVLSATRGGRTNVH